MSTLKEELASRTEVSRLRTDCNKIDNIRLVMDKLTQVHDVSKHVLLLILFFSR